METYSKLRASRSSYVLHLQKVIKELKDIKGQVEAGIRDEAKLLRAQQLRTTWALLEQKLNEVTIGLLNLDLNEDEFQEQLENQGQTIEINAEGLALLEWVVTKLQPPAVLPSPPSEHGGTTSSRSEMGGARAALPKLHLPTFAGSEMEYRPFMDRFRVDVLNQESLSKAQKLSYLRSCLKGEADEVVKGIPTTEENLQVALDLLRPRFGSPTKLIVGYAERIFAVPAAKGASDLRRVLDAFRNNYMQLLSLIKEVYQDTPTTPTLQAEARDMLSATEVSATEEAAGAPPLHELLLTPILIAKLPPSTTLEWNRRNDVRTRFCIERLLSFLESEVEAQTSSTWSSSSQGSSHSTRGSMQGTHKRRPSLHSTMQPATTLLCRVCDEETGKGHDTSDCNYFLSLPIAQRLELVRRKRLCFNCLGSHMKVHCTSKFTCRKCRRNHHSLLHEERAQEEGHQAQASHKVLSSAASASVLLQTAVVRVQGRKVRILLDGGSDQSYVKESLAQSLGIPMKEAGWQIVEVFGGRTSRTLKKTASLTFQGEADGGRHTIEATCVVTPRICSSPVRLPSRFAGCFPTGIQLADPVSSRNPEEVEVLLGMDVIPKILKEQPPSVHNGLLLTPTIFGTVVSGRLASGAATQCHRSLRVASMWELDNVGVTAEELSKDNDKLAPPIFKDGRYQVDLPFLDAQRPVNTLFQAKSRLQRRSTEVVAETFEDYIKRGVLEPASSTGGSFLPHHVVFAPGKSPRVVYDASAVGPNKEASLNECLSAGPNMLADLVETLLRFRRHEIALISDVEKAFLMVSVRPEHREFLKVAWWRQGNLTTHRFARVPFGLNCGPSLLLHAIHFHLSRCQEESGSTADWATRIKKDIYMDDLICSFPSELEARGFQAFAVETFKEIGMNLRKFRSNLDILSEADSPKDMKVLGLPWSRVDDKIMIDLKLNVNSPRLTRRMVASSVASVFDPLGLATPWTTTLRLFLQGLWGIEGYGWDDVLPVGLARQWTQLLEFMKDQAVVLPRHCDVRELHIFCDASEKAYAAVVYGRDPEGKSHLILSRVKLTPLNRPKTLTLPRLELMGAMVAARLYLFTTKALEKKLPVRFYSDSQVALAWIRKPSQDLFVRNRVREIQKLSDPDDWVHVQGVENPADLPSRGFLSPPSEERRNLWVAGPRWLESDNPLSLRVLRVQSSPSDPPAWIDRFSKLFPLLKFRAIIERMIATKRRVHHKKGRVTPAELTSARRLLLKDVQAFTSEMDCLMKDKEVPPGSPIWDARPFIKDGVIKCQPRNNEPPLLWLPPGHLQDLLIQEAHEKVHHLGAPTTLGEIKKQFWISHGRRAVRKILNKCQVCRRQSARLMKPSEGHLPAFRTTPARPFAHSGLDYFGPMTLRSSSKAYGLLFTCAVTRAVHIELTPSISTEATALAIRRFSARRGTTPSLFISDNGSSFVELSKVLSKNFEWTLIPAAAPWWGGFWERLVGTVKRSLTKTLGHSSLSFDELSTVLTEVEDRVNRRPLVSTSQEEAELTPAHFLFSSPPPPVSPVMERLPSTPPLIELKSLSAKQQEFVRQTWETFERDYIQSLRNWRRKLTTPQSLQVGDVVLVEPATKLPRNLWRRARVHELLPGKDKIVRAVILKTGTGFISRPLQRLALLETVNDLAAQPPAESAVGPPPQDEPPAVLEPLPPPHERPQAPEIPHQSTRTGRQVRKPVKFKDYV